jgi:hypothetical protein
MPQELPEKSPAPTQPKPAADRFAVGTKVQFAGGKARGVVTGRNPQGVCVDFTHHAPVLNGVKQGEDLTISGTYLESEITPVPTTRP